MTPKEKAQEILRKYKKIMFTPQNPTQKHQYDDFIKKCALISVNYIITSNPHSNPFNTNMYSTIDYWQEVKEEIKKL